jgi:HlyD family secretion protein
MTDQPTDPRRAIRRLNIIGFTAILLLIGGFGGWAATTELAGAVIASGWIVVESNIKKVQHPTGGIVGEILVREGSEVEQGQVVVRLDDTVTRATLGIVQSQLDELAARLARLIAERDYADAIDFPKRLLDRRAEVPIASALSGEEKLFDARRKALVGQKAQLQERVAQIHEEIAGLSSQFEAKNREIAFIKEELEGVSALFKQNLVSIVRYMALQRDQARLQGESGQLTAEIARARGRITETELQIIQLEQNFRTDVLKDIREADGKVAELSERRTQAEDQLRRVEIRSPQTGYVHQLTVHTVGGVIGNGETIMQIVPRADVLIVEAKVAPQDIDQIAVGAKSNVRIMAGNRRTVPEISGVVTYVAADLQREPQQGQQQQQQGGGGTAYFLVRATLAEEEVKKLGDLRLIPGMPVEVFIETHMRTPLEYLLKPLTEQIARTFRER